METKQQGQEDAQSLEPMGKAGSGLGDAPKGRYSLMPGSALKTLFFQHPWGQGRRVQATERVDAWAESGSPAPVLGRSLVLLTAAQRSQFPCTCGRHT